MKNKTHGLLNDKEIKELAKDGLISPFEEEQVEGGKISFGTSSFGYDMRAAKQAEILNHYGNYRIDPKNFDEKGFVNDLTLEEGEHGKFFTIPGNSFALMHSVERFDMPENLTGIVVGKSTYARCGVIIPITPVEAGWRGHLTIEVSNTTQVPAKVYAYEGIAQIIFFRSRAPEMSYDNKTGKYQDQPKRIVHPKIA